MPKAIAIDGPDGAGKTTLINRLASDLGREVIHSGGPPKSRQEWTDRQLRFRGLARQPVLIDRLPHISEQIYGPLYNRKVDTALNREVLELNPVIVFCCLRDEFEMLRYIDQGPKAHKPSSHMELVLDHHPSIVLSYKRLMIHLACKGAQIIPYSWPDDRYENLLQELKKCAA
jgi:adenylate kinase family enzyme